MFHTSPNESKSNSIVNQCVVSLAETSDCQQLVKRFQIALAPASYPSPILPLHEASVLSAPGDSIHGGGQSCCCNLPSHCSSPLSHFSYFDMCKPTHTAWRQRTKWRFQPHLSFWMVREIQASSGMKPLFSTYGREH